MLCPGQVQVNDRESNNVTCMQHSQHSLNGHLYKMDTSIKQTPGVGPVPVVFSYFTVTKLPIRLTPLLDRQVKPVPMVSILERVDCIGNKHKDNALYNQLKHNQGRKVWTTY